MKYHLVTLGCQMNKSDSERVRTVVEAMGYEWTGDEQEANLLGILACSVRQKSIDKVFSRIHKWNSWKNHRNLITFLSGCILPADREKLLKQFDLVFEISELPQFSYMLSQYGIVTPVSYRSGLPATVETDRQQKEKTGLNTLAFPIEETANKGINKLITRPEEKIKDFWQIKPTCHSSFEAFIPIQNGCDKFCSFCAVPYTRGREISRPSGEIMDELKELVSHGYKSITLLGQNVNSYGLDKNGHEITFPVLLRKIGEYGKTSGKDFWIYFTSPHPRDMTRDVIEVISQYDCLAKQIHLPLQSGDDEVLKKMNRRYTTGDYRKIIHLIRKLLPEATIFTDIIVGFAGETDEQFENSRRAMEEFRFNMAYIARYSPRPGAASSRWADDVPGEIKTKRLHILTGELTRHTIGYNTGLTGKKLRVLVTGKDRKEGYLSALTEGKIVLRFRSDEESLTGRFVEVIVESAAEYALEAKFNKELITEET
ncbi:MAG: MiaB/RimO family radical SAM methylthiotransferase [Bacteroidales bacterium]|nr:MiaB/RimO family radical SAM methylthiotransferase [Bacteroidales bacterium]